MAVVLVQSGFIVRHDLVHLVSRCYSLIELHTHLFQVLLEPEHELEHLLCTLSERYNLLILPGDLAVCYSTNETVVSLDSCQLVFRRDLRQQRKFTLQRRSRRLNEDLELL